MLGGAGRDLARDVAEGLMPLPTLDYFRQARLKLDMMSILFERQLHVRWVFWRYLLIDASPQFGHDYLIITEDRFRFPRSAALDSVSQAKVNLNQSYETRTCPVSTIGKGHATAEKKCINVASVYIMESESEEQFDETREEVLGVTTDQGTERLVTDLSVRILEGRQRDFAAWDPRSFMYPKAANGYMLSKRNLA